MWSTLVALWNIAGWVHREKKAMERDAKAYLTQERARAWRENAEKMFHALATGNGNLASLPKPVRWFFKKTEVDNRVGFFGMWLLKSRKLETNHPVLGEKIDPYRAH